MKAYPILILGALSLSAGAAPLKIELPAESLDLKPGENRDVLMANCLTCHSVDYIVSQPPLSEAAWKGIVTKMGEKFGATVPEDQNALIVEYLSANYSEPVKEVPGKPAK